MKAGVVWVVIMRVLRAVLKALLACHRWFMKYSGMTMIIENVEERRRGREEEYPPAQNSGPRAKEYPPGEMRNRTPSPGPD